MRKALLLTVVLMLLISGCERRDALWLVFAKGVEGEGAVRATVISRGKTGQELRIPSSGFLHKGETVSGEVRLSPGDELRLELEGSGEPRALVAVCRPGTEGPTGWRLLYGPCLPDWPPARFGCVVGAPEWEELVSFFCAPRKPLPADLFRVRGVAPGDTRERVANLLGPPAERRDRESLPLGNDVECWEYPFLTVYLDHSGRVLSLVPRNGHGGVSYGEAYSALLEKWDLPDRVVPSPHSEEWLVAAYERPQGKAYWVVGENRVVCAWVGEFLAD
ncbi:MAG: hypothetical protein ACUVTQ_06080 [Desulfotomaculales bacterium]